MNRKLVLIFSFIFTIGLFSNCEAQEKSKDAQKNEGNQTGATASARIPRPADEAKIIGNFPDYEIKQTNLEYLQTLKMPEVIFVFETRQIESEDLPEEVKDILRDYWKETVKIKFETYLHKSKDAQTQLDKILAWSAYSTKSELKLQNIFIEAPQGSRKNSQTESSEITKLFIESAIAVMDEIKSLQLA